MSYLIDDIISLEGEASSNLLNIAYLFKEVKKTMAIEFTNAYEKYVFKSIVHNHLVKLTTKIFSQLFFNFKHKIIFLDLCNT